MVPFKIGVMVDSFRLDFYDGLKVAKELGAEGIQIYTTNGAMAPENLSKLQRKEILNQIKSSGLMVAALCGDLGGHGFSIRKDNPWKIEKSKRILELAKDLETNVVTTHIGVIPEDSLNPRFEILQEACGILGEYADNIGACFAIETGPEKAKILKTFLDSLKSNGIKVNFDPANFVMVTGDDPVEAVYTLKDYIIHTHAKDGIMKKKHDVEKLYTYFAEGGIEDIHLEDYFLEVPLGKGDVNFPLYLKALNGISYNGFLTIEREVGENPIVDVKEAIDFLKRSIINFNCRGN